MIEYDDHGWEDALDDLTKRLKGGVPFCHVRFGDGELNAACGIYDGKPNCDGVVYTDQIARQMRRVFEEMRTTPNDGSYVPGGTCVADEAHRKYLELLGYPFTKFKHRPDDWVPCHVIAEGVTTLRTLPMVEELVRLGGAGRTVLVGSQRLTGACRSSLLQVGEKAVDDLEATAGRIKGFPPGTVVLYCAGTPGKVMAWDAWKARPDLTHIDMGHFFDRAYGRDNRMWHAVWNERREAYDRHFVKLIRGA